MKNIQLVAFLGNYGKKYEKTRHNVAWLFSNSIQSLSGIQKQSKFKGEYARIGDVHYLWPQTFMNLSGESVIECATFFKIPPENILVIHDELELAPGTISLKWSGGLGGHNGLRSMKSCFGTADFWRLRFGIGRPGGVKAQGQDIAGYVLSPFTADESIILDQTFMRTQELFASLVSGDDPKKLLPKWQKVRLVD